MKGTVGLCLVVAVVFVGYVLVSNKKMALGVAMGIKEEVVDIGKKLEQKIARMVDDGEREKLEKKLETNLKSIEEKIERLEGRGGEEKKLDAPKIIPINFGLGNFTGSTPLNDTFLKRNFFFNKFQDNEKEKAGAEESKMKMKMSIASPLAIDRMIERLMSRGLSSLDARIPELSRAVSKDLAQSRTKSPTKPASGAPRPDEQAAGPLGNHQLSNGLDVDLSEADRGNYSARESQAEPEQGSEDLAKGQPQATDKPSSEVAAAEKPAAEESNSNLK